jgi:hypothetical protein
MDYGMAHDDAAEDQALFDPKFQAIAQVIDLLLNVAKGLSDRVDALEKVLIEDLIGGIANEGRRIKRTSLAGQLKETFPTLGKYSGAFKQLFDQDLEEYVLDKIYPDMESAGFAPEKLKELGEGLMSDLSSRFKGLVPEDEAPAVVEIEVEKAPEVGLKDDLDGVNPSVAAYLRKERAAKKGA